MNASGAPDRSGVSPEHSRRRAIVISPASFVLIDRSKRCEQALLLRTVENQRDLLTRFVKADAARQRQSQPPDIEWLYAKTLELQLNRRALR